MPELIAVHATSLDDPGQFNPQLVTHGIRGHASGRRWILAADIRANAAWLSSPRDSGASDRRPRSWAALAPAAVASGARFFRADCAETFSATAARMSAFNAFSSILSPSWKSMARRVLPSRLELKRPDGSVQRGALGEGHLHDGLVGLAGADDAAARPHRNAAPLPLLDHVGVGLLDEALIRASVSPRQSPSSLILASISREESSPPFASFAPLPSCSSLAFFMAVAFAPLTSVRRAIGWLASPRRRAGLRRAGRPRGCRGSALPCAWTRRAGQGAATCRGRRPL